MIRVGITGKSGFIGTHLTNELGLFPGKYQCVVFKDSFFSDASKLRSFVKKCDVVVHLAAMNRHPDPKVLYETNISLVNNLIKAMDQENVTPHVLFSSSSQEELDNPYGKSKLEGREIFEDWAKRSGASFSGLVVPNVYGPFGRPNYNSFIATFCHKLTHNEEPQVLTDSKVKLIYIGNLCKFIINQIEEVNALSAPQIKRVAVPFDFDKKVSKLLSTFNHFKQAYFDSGIIPTLKNSDEINLFNTFRSYIDINDKFPVKLIKHDDERGVFVETLRLGIGGQVSFSTTVPGITRGEHYHTRKIERFTVIKGKALIQLRKIGTDKIHDLYLDGNEPAYVDMPIWYTHNIKNVGEDELYTQFWINEWYDPEDADTYFEAVKLMTKGEDK